MASCHVCRRTVAFSKFEKHLRQHGESAAVLGDDDDSNVASAAVSIDSDSDSSDDDSTTTAVAGGAAGVGANNRAPPGVPPVLTARDIDKQLQQVRLQQQALFRARVRGPDARSPAITSTSMSTNETTIDADGDPNRKQRRQREPHQATQRPCYRARQPLARARSR